MIEGVGVALEADPASFFRRLYASVYRWVAKASGAAHADVEDLVQETLLQAWAGRDRFRGEAAPLSWVVAIARNKVRDRFKRRTAVDLHEALDRLEDRPIPDALAASDEARRLVRRALEALPAEYARLLRWRYLEGASVRSMAERLGESEKAAESRLHRAREAFREILGREEDDDA